MQTVEAQYIYDQREFLRAFKFAGYTQIRRSLRFLYLLLALLFGVTGSIHILYYDQFGAFFLLIIAIVMVFAMWYQAIQAKKEFEKSPHKDARLVWNFGEEQIRVVTSISDSTFDWRNIVTAVQTKEGYLLFVGPRIFSWVPQRAFASQEDFETFEKLVKEKVTVIKKV